MHHLKQLSPTVLILTVGQLIFALAIIAITGHGLATLDYAPYEPAFFSPLAKQLESGTLAASDESTVAEIVRSFPIEVNRALQLSRHADKTALAIALCMLALPVAIVLRPPRRKSTKDNVSPKAQDATLYLVIETYKAGKQHEIYERVRNQGRMLPDGLTYIDSWVTQDLTRCYQLMSSSDPQLLQQWREHWADLVDFEVLAVLESAQAAQRILQQS